MSQRLLIGIALLFLIFSGGIGVFISKQRPHDTKDPQQSAQQYMLIENGGVPQRIKGYFPSVRDLLQAADINLNPHDRIVPSLNNVPAADTPIRITRAHAVAVTIDGQMTTHYTHEATLGAFLWAAGIKTTPQMMIVADQRPTAYDQLNITVLPRAVSIQTTQIKSADLSNPLTSTRANIEPTRLPLPTTLSNTPESTVSQPKTGLYELIENVDTSIPFETQWEASDLFELDTTGVITAGQPGIQRQAYRVIYEDGVEVTRVFVRDYRAQEPVDQVNGYGTRIVVRKLDTPSGTFHYWRKVEMRVTSYTAATSGKVRSHPAYGITASGVMAGYGVVAVDPSIVPWRSYVYVPGYGRGFVGDTGGGILGRWIDLGYDENAFEWWSGFVDVYHLTPVPEPERINYLLPQTLPVVQ